jgi:hypothetical protein
MLGREHLDDVRMGYFAHMGRALAIAARLVGAGFACLVHAFMPGLFVDSASRTVKTLHREMTDPRFAPAPHRLEQAEAEA